MPRLVGNETAEATLVIESKERPFACKFKAAATGTIEELKVTVKCETAETDCDIGIYSEGAGVPGVLKAHKKTGKIKIGEELTLTATGFSVAVTAGTTYWLAVVPTLGTFKLKYKKEAGKEDIKKGTTGTKAPELGEATTWEVFAESTLMTIWALGTETGGQLEGKAKGTILLGGTSKGVAANVVKGIATGPLLLGGTGKGVAANVVKGVGTGSLLLTGKAKGATAEALKGKAAGAILLTGTAKGTISGGAPVVGKATGTLTLTGSAKGTASNRVVGKATGALTLTGTAKGTLRAVVTGKASGALLLAGSSKGIASNRVGGKATGALLLVGHARTHETGPKLLLFANGASQTVTPAGGGSSLALAYP
jgi:hypothetical protein